MISSTGVAGVAAAHPALADLERVATAGDRDAVSAHLEQLSLQDPQDFWIGCSVVASAPLVETLISTWRTTDPTDPTAALLSAHHGIHAAWRERTSADAARVEADRAERFLRLLERTERDLLELCAREPELPDAWALRLVTARGLSFGESESARRYARLAAIDPHHVAGQRHRLQQLCPKWGAPDFTAAHAFARACGGAGRPDLGIDVHVADLALEQWHAEGGRMAVPTDLRREVDQASDRILTTAQASRFMGFFAHSVFGVVHSILRDDARAVEHLSRIGPVIDHRVADYLGKVERRRLDRLHAQALSQGSPR